MRNTFSIADLMWSVQRALIGEVTANTAAVTCALLPNLIRLRSYVFTGPNLEDKERLSSVAAPTTSLKSASGTSHLETCLSAWRDGRSCEQKSKKMPWESRGRL